MRLCSLLLSLCLALSPLSVANAGKLTKEQLTLFFGKDNRVPVPVSNAPWKSIGEIVTRGELECTGTLVAPDVVITAGHCFLGPNGTLDPAVSFNLGLIGDRYQQKIGVKEVYVSSKLLKGLIRRKDGIYIPPKVAAWDFAFIRLNSKVDKAYSPIPYFTGTQDELSNLLESLNYNVTQAGYPEDTDNIMMAHKNCKATGLLDDGRMGHQCDTLSGDSGSPVFAFIDGKAVIVAVQSSAPIASKRKAADNMAVSAPVFRQALEAFIRRGTH